MTLIQDALESVEWVQQFSNSRAECPWCGAYREDGHREGCRRQTALADAALHKAEKEYEDARERARQAEPVYTLSPRESDANRGGWS